MMRPTSESHPLSSPPFDTESELLLKENVPSKNLFPFSVVWGPLPLITWLFPFIGHMGICDSYGRVHDFAGPYYIGIDHFMTGDVYKYYRFSTEELEEMLSRSVTPEKGISRLWDESVDYGDRKYKKMMHNLCCNNCHHHTAVCLKSMGFDFTMMKAWWLLQTKGRYVR